MKEDYARKLEEMKKKQAEEEKKRKGMYNNYHTMFDPIYTVVMSAIIKKDLEG